jgi:hypothetical protein
VNGSLVLDHPDGGVDARARLALPDRVAAVEGEWHSRQATRVLVVPADSGDGVVLRLVNEAGPDPTAGADGEGSP